MVVMTSPNLSRLFFRNFKKENGTEKIKQKQKQDRKHLEDRKKGWSRDYSDYRKQKVLSQTAYSARRASSETQGLLAGTMRCSSEQYFQRAKE